MSGKMKLGIAVLATLGVTALMWIPAGYTEGSSILIAIIPLTIIVFYFGFTLIDNNDQRVEREQELLKRLEHMEQELAKLAGERDDSAQGAAEQPPEKDTES